MSFFLNDDDVELVYKNIRDLDGYFAEAKIFIEDLWTKCQQHHLLDSDHQIQAKRDFHSRFWEKYLAVTLLEHGLQPTKLGEGYPDFAIPLQNNLIHIEAVAPNSGSGKDVVPKHPLDGTAHYVPREKILLRLTNAIQRKHEKWLTGYSSKENVSISDPFIIAINGREIYSSLLGGNPPFILQALFSIGHLTVILNSNDSDYYQSQPKVLKTNQKEVQLGYFLSEEYAHISGIIYSDLNSVNRPAKMGGDFLFIPNPFTQNPVPKGLFSFCKQYHFKKIDETNFWFDIIEANIK
jgi:hypothetical protein